jgi:hypothetical protein
MSSQETQSPETTDAGVKTITPLGAQAATPEVAAAPAVVDVKTSALEKATTIAPSNRTVVIKAFINPVTGRTFKFDSVNTYLYILKDTMTGNWLMPCSAADFAKEYKLLGSKLTQVIHNPDGNGMRYVWNDKELSKTKLIIPANGMVLQEANELHKLFINLLQFYPRQVSMTATREMPTQTFYVYDEVKELKEKVSTGHLKAKAYATIQKLTTEDLICIMGLYNYGTKNLSRDLMEGRLYSEIDSNPAKFLEYADLTPDVKLRSYVNLAIEYSLILYKGGAYYLQDELVGVSIDAVVSKLNEKNMHQQKAILETKVRTEAKINI